MRITETRELMRRDSWAPVTPGKWQFPGDEVVLAEPGEQRPGPRRPFEYAVLRDGPEWGSVQIDAEVAIDVPAPAGRDVIVVFGYRCDTEFYYVHLSDHDTVYAHNGIFVVDDADRRRIDHQWDGATGAAPAISDQRYHQVRVKHCARTGEIAVYLDGAERPLMTATDTTFDGGRVGFGSFDDVGRIRNLTVTGTDRARGHVEQE